MQISVLCPLGLDQLLRLSYRAACVLFDLHDLGPELRDARQVILRPTSPLAALGMRKQAGYKLGEY